MKKRLNVVVNFIVLTIILISTVVLFWVTGDNKSMQIFVGLLLSILYVTWGIIHHAMEGNLHPKIVVEYLLVGAIAMILIVTLVWM